MAIKIITGKPGSGKTYYAISKVILEGFQFEKKYYDWNPILGKEVTIISNIDSLRVPHHDLNQMIVDYADGNYEKFFTAEIQQTLTNKFPRIRYIIDECQRFFHSKFHNKETFFYFQYHRHYGHDIYLIAQCWDSISKHITGLCEYEYRAVPRSMAVLSEFTYHVYAGFDRVGTVRLSSDKRIFALYQSFQAQDIGKNIRPTRKFALVFVALVVLTVGFTYGWLSSFSQKAGGGRAPAGAAAAPPSSQPAVPPVASPRPAPAGTLSRPVSSPAPAPAPSGSPPASTPSKPSFLITQAGGVWIGNDLRYIQYDGKLIPIERFPYQFIPSDDRHFVSVLLPDVTLTPAP